jgi:hypothetical protein
MLCYSAMAVPLTLLSTWVITASQSKYKYTNGSEQRSDALLNTFAQAYTYGLHLTIRANGCPPAGISAIFFLRIAVLTI